MLNRRPLGDSWRNAVVSIDATLENAIATLDSGGLRIVLITDGEGILRGIMTDGDVRRAILAKMPLEMPVSGAMNTHPKSARDDSSIEMRRAFLERHAHHVPLVDAEGRLVGLDTYFDILSKPERDNWVFLMAGGFGRRLGELTRACPKPMLPVNGKPILETIIDDFVAAGFRRFYISLHFLPDVIRNHFGDGSSRDIEIRYVLEETPLGTGGALGLIPSTDELPMVMMNGDILTKVDFGRLLQKHEDDRSVITVCTREYDLEIPFGVISHKGSRIEGIVEKPVHKYFVNGGIYVVSPEVVARCAPARRLDMPDLIRQEIAEGKLVSMFPISDYWLDVGRPDDFDRAQRDMGS